MSVKDFKKRVASIVTELDNLATDMRDFAGERSDQWQESDAGAAFEGSIDTIENASHDLDAIDWSA